MIKKEIRLDELELSEVDNMYKLMFGNLISDCDYKKAYELCSVNYSEMIKAENNKIAPPPSMGRGYKYVRNMIYGWFFEDLFYELLKKNKTIKNIELTGNDREHKIIYDYTTKKSKILGEKTTFPDYLLTLNDGNKMYLELKTAAKGIYSIKIGNVKQLYKTMGESQIFSCIIMIDLVNETYSIHSVESFINQHPFVNNRMEGQLCYYIPQPTNSFSNLINENFTSYIKNEIFNITDVKKYEYLMKAKDNNKDVKLISEKIKLDDLYFDFKFREQEFNNTIEKISNKFKDIDIVNTTWEDLFKRIDNER